MGSRLAELRESNRYYDDKMHRIGSEMHEAAIVSGELIERIRASLREADRVFGTQVANKQGGD